MAITRARSVKLEVKPLRRGAPGRPRKIGTTAPKSVRFRPSERADTSSHKTSQTPSLGNTPNCAVNADTDAASAEAASWRAPRRSRDPEFIGITDARISNAGKIREKTFYGLSAVEFLGKNRMSRNTFDWILDRVIEISGAGDVDENNVRHFTLRTGLALLIQFAAGLLTSSFTYLEEYGAATEDDPSIFEFPSGMLREHQERIKCMAAIEEMRKTLTSVCPVYFSMHHPQLSETLSVRDDYLVRVFPRYKNDESCMPTHEWHAALSLVYQMMIDHSEMKWCATGPLRVNMRKTGSEPPASQYELLKVAMRMLGEYSGDEPAAGDEHMDSSSMVDDAETIVVKIEEDESKVSVDNLELLSSYDESAAETTEPAAETSDFVPETSPLSEMPSPIEHPEANEPLSSILDSYEAPNHQDATADLARMDTGVYTVSWDAEKTTCIVVSHGEHRIPRRCDNNMINGTRLLDAIGVTNGRRDKLLMMEPTSRVISDGPDPLRGVWVSYDSAKRFAKECDSVSKFYPLFQKNLESVVQRQANQDNRQKLPIPANLLQTPAATELSEDLKDMKFVKPLLPTLYCQRATMNPTEMGTLVDYIAWESEKTSCIVVSRGEHSILRRCDNHMINGTKFLNAMGMSRGRRDGLLKKESTKHIVMDGPKLLKGVWIPYTSAMKFAEGHNVAAKFHPLLERDIESLIIDQTNKIKRGETSKVLLPATGMSVSSMPFDHPLVAPQSISGLPMYTGSSTIQPGLGLGFGVPNVFHLATGNDVRGSSNANLGSSLAGQHSGRMHQGHRQDQLQRDVVFGPRLYRQIMVVPVPFYGSLSSRPSLSRWQLEQEIAQARARRYEKPRARCRGRSASLK